MYKYDFTDYEKAKADGKLHTFLKAAIAAWKDTDTYKNYHLALQYFNEENPTINSRRFFYATKVKDKYGNVVDEIRESKFKSNFKIASGMFRGFIEEKVEYTIGNGVNTTDENKNKLGKNIDRKLQVAGLESSLGSVSWAYCYLEEDGTFNTQIFTCAEFIPLVNTATNLPMVGIRFWEVPHKDLTYIELYEQEGMTRYKTNGKILLEDKPFTPYKKTMIAYRDGVYTDLSQEVFELPIVPFYNNTEKRSDFTRGLKNKLDAYDILSSDFVNILTDGKEFVWFVENYDGDLDNFKQELEAYGVVRSQTDGDKKATATPHTISIPYEARKAALDILKKQIYADARALDPEIITGGNMRVEVMKAAYQKLHQKSSSFEWGALDFVHGIRKIRNLFMGTTEEIEIKDFIRVTLIENKPNSSEEPV